MHLDLGHVFSFIILYTVGRTPWTGDQPVSRPLPTHRTALTQNTRRQTSMPGVGFEPTILVFERAKTVHAFDRAVTVMDTGLLQLVNTKNYSAIANSHTLHFRVRVLTGCRLSQSSSWPQLLPIHCIAASGLHKVSLASQAATHPWLTRVDPLLSSDSVNSGRFWATALETRSCC
jgi:hypothetical protein